MKPRTFIARPLRTNPLLARLLPANPFLTRLLRANPVTTRPLRTRLLPGLPLTALFLTILWTSCSKNHSVDNPDNTTTKLVTQTSWKYDTSGVDLNKDGTVDVGGDTLIRACEKDDIYTFKSDSTGTIDEGPAKCNASDPQTVPFKWSINSTQTVLTASAPPLLNGDINILSLTSAKFVLYKDTIVAGINVRYLFSLKH